MDPSTETIVDGLLSDTIEANLFMGEQETCKHCQLTGFAWLLHVTYRVEGCFNILHIF